MERPKYRSPWTNCSIFTKGMVVVDDKSGFVFKEKWQVYQDGLSLNSRKPRRLDRKVGGVADK